MFAGHAMAKENVSHDLTQLSVQAVPDKLSKIMAAQHAPIILLPMPRRMDPLPGFHETHSDSQPHVLIDPSIGSPQSYRLSITPSQIRIIGNDLAGAFHGRQTLDQLRRQFSSHLPCLQIEDAPDFPVRGVMLDISRDKVPTMQTLFDLIDRLAQWKINQLQLYTEHTFAYRGHEEVWQSASPITPEEIRRLDEYCKQCFIELVPNQNSFGHMERWLKHPGYLHLAEAAAGAETPWGYRWQGPFSLCPTDPLSLELLNDLYSQLLPDFTSKLFNVGCDETFDLGQGRSREVCEKRGVQQVYLEFLSRVNGLVKANHRQMMFWGDIILNHPECIPRLPQNVIALNWGYEADHPFETEAGLFHDSNVPFYVCPGTSSWCSIAGRTQNMLANQLTASQAGLAHGAAGFLNTDWGDYGHLQYLPISYAGLATGAAISWCLATNRDLPLAQALDLHAFEDRASIMGQLALDLGNVYRAIGKLIKNRSALFNILVPSASRSDAMQDITLKNIEFTERAIAAAMLRLNDAKMIRPDADLIKKEFATAAQMLSHACVKARWKLSPTQSQAEELTDDLNHLLQSHRDCWQARNRPGGLEDSLSRLSDNLKEYGA
ncbi:MAG: family 20 glycosylhydrolase [Planctomycetota bacterium]|nr:family 20 glycosylhydrolase [Planctomycetota bacterium]